MAGGRCVDHDEVVAPGVHEIAELPDGDQLFDTRPCRDELLERGGAGEERRGGRATRLAPQPLAQRGGRLEREL